MSGVHCWRELAKNVSTKSIDPGKNWNWLGVFKHRRTINKVDTEIDFSLFTWNMILEKLVLIFMNQYKADFLVWQWRLKIFVFLWTVRYWMKSNRFILNSLEIQKKSINTKKVWGLVWKDTIKKIAKVNTNDTKNAPLKAKSKNFLLKETIIWDHVYFFCWILWKSEILALSPLP